jgi:hypothetical protein
MSLPVAPTVLLAPTLLHQQQQRESKYPPPTCYSYVQQPLPCPIRCPQLLAQRSELQACLASCISQRLRQQQQSNKSESGHGAWHQIEYDNWHPGNQLRCFNGLECSAAA